MGAEEHTPGPWKATSAGKHGGWWVRGPDEDNHAIVPLDNYDYGPIDTEADARLIAAAPDLLAALEQIAQISPVGDFEVHRAVDIARAAIAKAKG